MEILDEGVLYKALTVPENTLNGGQTWKAIYEVIDYVYFKQYNVYHFIPVEVKKSIQTIGLEYVLFSKIIKIKRTIVVEYEKS